MLCTSGALIRIRHPDHMEANTLMDCDGAMVCCAHADQNTWKITNLVDCDGTYSCKGQVQGTYHNCLCSNWLVITIHHDGL